MNPPTMAVAVVICGLILACAVLGDIVPVSIPRNSWNYPVEYTVDDFAAAAESFSATTMTDRFNGTTTTTSVAQRVVDISSEGGDVDILMSLDLSDSSEIHISYSIALSWGVIREEDASGRSDQYTWESFNLALKDSSGNASLYSKLFATTRDSPTLRTLVYKIPSGWKTTNVDLVLSAPNWASGGDSREVDISIQSLLIFPTSYHLLPHGWEDLTSSSQSGIFTSVSGIPGPWELTSGTPSTDAVIKACSSTRATALCMASVSGNDSRSVTTSTTASPLPSYVQVTGVQSGTFFSPLAVSFGEKTYEIHCGSLGLCDVLIPNYHPDYIDGEEPNSLSVLQAPSTDDSNYAVSIQSLIIKPHENLGWAVPGIAGYAMDMSVLTSTFGYADSFIVDNTDAGYFSASAWVKLTGNVFDFMEVVHYDNEGKEEHTFKIGFRSFDDRDNSGLYPSLVTSAKVKVCATAIDLDTWTHVAWGRDNNYGFWINGEYKSHTSEGGSDNSYDNTSKSHTVTLGDVSSHGDLNLIINNVVLYADGWGNSGSDRNKAGNRMNFYHDLSQDTEANPYFATRFENPIVDGVMVSTLGNDLSGITWNTDSPLMYLSTAPLYEQVEVPLATYTKVDFTLVPVGGGYGATHHNVGADVFTYEANTYFYCDPSDPSLPNGAIPEEGWSYISGADPCVLAYSSSSRTSYIWYTPTHRQETSATDYVRVVVVFG